MNKLFWLTSTAIVWCCFAMAQKQANDSTTNPQQSLVAGKDSLFTDFSYSIKDRAKIWLHWKSDSVKEGDFFVMERSDDGNRFETVEALKCTPGISDYEITDNAPLAGHNFYRIHYTGEKGKSVYSKIVQADLFQSGFKFYPNPVDKLLIIQSDHFSEMQILNQSGAVLISSQLQAGLQVINVSSLEKGNYLLRVSDKKSKRDITEQLLKN
ncbi:MAG: T9SS type A sorting domain-containing protein [Bacteroidetes bacterium]|nr:T9SS type A sorting domain-containing protein [Bacteroidota bacterium]